MSCTPIPIDLATQLFSRDPQRLYGPIAKSLITQVPYISALRSGTFPAAVSATLLSVAQGRSLLETSLANPSFTSMLNLCGSCSLNVDQNGTNQYSYIAEINQGMSDKICLNQGFSAFLGSLTAQLEAYQNGVTELINADVRWQLFLRSGVKMVVQAGGVGITSQIYGGEYNIDEPVPAVQSTAQLTFGSLQSVNRYMRSALRAKPFGAGAAAHARFIGSPDILDALRNDLGGAAGPGGANIVPLGQVAAGGNKMAQDALTSYMFEPLYRGIQMGEDPIPLRLNWNGAGYDPVDPNTSYSSTVGTVATVSDAWLNASHEVAFLMFDGSFERQGPAPWTGEGKIRFQRQLFGGEIQFLNHPDMSSNLFGDYGVMAYRIGRAYRPIYPWFVLPIIYKRCKDTDNLTTCTGVSG
jgi:hypothetical protein